MYTLARIVPTHTFHLMNVPLYFSYDHLHLYWNNNKAYYFNLIISNNYPWSAKWKCLLLLDKLTALMDWAATSRQFSCRPITCVWLFYSSKLRRRWLLSGRRLSRVFLYQSNYPFFWYIRNPMFNFGAIKNWPKSLFWTRKIHCLY